MPMSSLLQKNIEEEEDDKILTIKENLDFPEDDDPLGQIMKKFRLDKVPKIEIEMDVEVESNLLTIEDIKVAREAAEIRWKEKNSVDTLKNHYMDYAIRNKIEDLEIVKYFDVKRMKLPRPVLPKLIYDDSELISKIEEVRAKYEKYKKEGNYILENELNEKENNNKGEAEKMEIESELPLREMGIRLSSNIFEDDNTPNQQKQQQQTEQTYINLHDKQFPVTILPMGAMEGRGGPSKNILQQQQQSAAAAIGITPRTHQLHNLHMQSFPLNLLPNKKILFPLPPQSKNSASPSPASISIIKPKQTAINPQNLLKMLGALKSKQNQQLSAQTTPKPLPPPPSTLSNVKLTFLDEDGTTRIVNTGYFDEKSQKKAEEETKKDKKEAEGVTISIVPEKTIPEFFVCRALSCGKAFPLNSDHLFRSHMVIDHNLELSEESILKSLGRTANIFKCLKCTSLIVDVEEHSKICWNTGDKPFPFEEGFEQIKVKESQKKPLKCGLCELKSFDTRIHLKQHFSQFHPELDRKVILDPAFRCGLCLKKFEGAISLVRHVINCEVNGNRPTKETQNELARGLLYCDICQKEHVDLTESQNCYHQHSLIRCILCLFTVKTKSSFFHHVKSFHANVNANNTDVVNLNANKKISCPFCRFCNNKSIREAFEHILSIHYTVSIQRAMKSAINLSQKSNFFCILPKNNQSSSTTPPAPPGISQPQVSGSPSEIFSIQNSLILTDLMTDSAGKSETTTTSSPATTTTNLLQAISNSPVKIATLTSTTTTSTATIPTTINLSQIHPSRIRQVQIRPGQRGQNVIFLNHPKNPASASGKYMIQQGQGHQGTSSSATTATGLKYFPMIPIGNKGQNENEDNSTNAPAQPKPQHILRPMITLIRQRSPTPMPTIIRPGGPVGSGNWQQQQQINIPPWIRNDIFAPFPKTFSVNVNNSNANVNVSESMEVDGNDVDSEKRDDEEIIGI